MSLESEGYELLMSPQGAEVLRTEASRYSEPIGYISDLDRRYASDMLHRYIVLSANFVEPEDRVLGRDPELPAAKYFVMGALLGLRVIDIFVPPPCKKVMKLNGIPIDIPGEELDDMEKRYTVAVDVVNMSEEGYARAEAYHDLLEEWADDVCPMIARQAFFKRGFGLMFYLMEQARKTIVKQDLHQLEHQLDEGVHIDWDAEFEKLTGEK